MALDPSFTTRDMPSLPPTPAEIGKASAPNVTNAKIAPLAQHRIGEDSSSAPAETLKGNDLTDEANKAFHSLEGDDIDASFDEMLKEMDQALQNQADFQEIDLDDVPDVPVFEGLSEMSQAISEMPEVEETQKEAAPPPVTKPEEKARELHAESKELKKMPFDSFLSLIKSMKTAIRSFFSPSKKTAVETLPSEIQPEEVGQILKMSLTQVYSEERFGKMEANWKKYGDKMFDPQVLHSAIQKIPDAKEKKKAMKLLMQFQLKMLGHEFGLGGSIEMPTSKLKSLTHKMQTSLTGGTLSESNSLGKVALEGFIRQTSHSKIAHSFTNFLQKSKELAKDKKITTCMETLQKSAQYGEYSTGFKSTVEKKATEILDDFKKGLPVTIGTGWSGHAVEVTLLGDMLCYSNRGMSFQDPLFLEKLPPPDNREARMCLYKINPNMVTKDFIVKLLETDAHSYDPEEINKYKEEKQAYLEKGGMLRELTQSTTVSPPSPIWKIWKSPQKVGNCTFANAKCGMQATMLLQMLKEKREKDPELERVRDIIKSCG